MSLQKQIVTGIGYTNYLFFAISFIAVLVFFLDSVKDCDDAYAFCTTAIFLLVMISSLVGLILLAWISGNFGVPMKNVRISGEKGAHFKVKGDVKLYFLEDITAKKLALVVPGLGGVFFVSYLSILTNLPLLGIFASGVIMMVIFFMTNSAMPPILIHGAYNAIIVGLRSQQLTLFSTSPISVPEIGSLPFFDERVINEMLTQILLVAPAEELFKIFMVTVFLIGVKLKFDTEGIMPKIIAGGLSVGIWAVYHLEIALT